MWYEKTWSVLSSALGRNKHRRSPTSIIFGEKRITDEKSIADNFNLLFTSAGDDIASKIPPSDLRFHNFMPRPTRQSMFINPVSQSDIINVIHKLKPKTSSGFDSVSCKLMKCIAEYIIDPLTHIVNVSICTGIGPSQMKLAKVIPIYKKGDSNNSSNYRPVSLLNSSIFENFRKNYVSKSYELSWNK